VSVKPRTSGGMTTPSEAPTRPTATCSRPGSVLWVEGTLGAVACKAFREAMHGAALTERQVSACRSQIPEFSLRGRIRAVAGSAPFQAGRYGGMTRGVRIKQTGVNPRGVRTPRGGWFFHRESSQPLVTRDST
jgi:hypothetical protein